MLKINGRYVMAEVPDIILTLRSQLAAQGQDYFKHIRPSGTNIQITCPFHSGGKERRPSCGIACQDTGKVPAGAVHCFTCGWSGTIEMMISNLLGFDDFGAAGARWILKNFVVVEVEDRPDLKLDFGKPEKARKQKFISEEELDKYRYYHPYLAKRGLTEETCDKFDIGYDPKRKCITTPVRDEFGRCLFVATREINSKIFNLPKDIEKPVYGLYEIGANKLDEILVCESVFNAATAWQYGRPAVALFGTGDAVQYAKLRGLRCRKFVLALDPDEAGRKGEARFISALGKYKLITKLKIPVGKDVNDLSEEEFLSLKEIFA